MALTEPSRAFVNCPPGADGQLLTPASRVGEFWAMFGIELEDEEANAAIKLILKDLKQTHGCITIGSMLALSYNAIRLVVCKAGRGEPGWISSIETLLDHTFIRLSDCAPESAHLGLSCPLKPPRDEEDEPPARAIELFTPRFKLGPRLVRNGRMNELALPFDKLDAVIEDCTEPATMRLSYNDTKAVAAEVFTYMALVHKYVAGDKIIFKNLGKQLSERYPTPWKGKWRKILKVRFKHGRSKKARGLSRVRLPTTHVPACCLSVPYMCLHVSSHAPRALLRPATRT